MAVDAVDKVDDVEAAFLVPAQGSSGSRSGTATFTQVFNFDASNAGQVVEAAVLDSTFMPLAGYTTAGIVEAGAGQYVGTFTAPAGFAGFVQARLQAQPSIVDTYPVNLLPAATIQAILVSEAGASSFPPSVFPISVFRSRLRSLIYDSPLDVPTGETVDPSLLTVLADTDLDEALREGLAALSQWRPAERALPPLSLVSGQSVYPLPVDFADPVIETWGSFLAPDGILSGRFPGARYALLRRQALLDAPGPMDTRGGGFGYGYGLGYGSFWAGLSFDGAFPILPEDADGNLIAGGVPFGCPSAAFYPASFDAPSPVLVLSPWPSAAQTLTTLRYKAAHLPQRLTVDPSTGAWQVDGSGNLVFTVVPLALDFVNATDILPFSPNDYEPIRLLLRYATAWALMQKIIPLSESDEEKYAFYSVRTGLGRKDIQNIADRAMNEFNERTKRVAHGGRY